MNDKEVALRCTENGGLCQIPFYYNGNIQWDCAEVEGRRLCPSKGSETMWKCNNNSKPQLCYNYHNQQTQMELCKGCIGRGTY